MQLLQENAAQAVEGNLQITWIKSFEAFQAWYEDILFVSDTREVRRGERGGTVGRG